MYYSWVIDGTFFLVQGPMSEEENRAWVRGANSETSLRTYRKEGPGGGPLDGPGGGFGGWGQAGAGGGQMGDTRGGMRGRGRGIRGGFDRQLSNLDDEIGGRGGIGLGRGRGFERSQSSVGPGSVGGGPLVDDPLANGSVSPRKGYTRAPFADWRKPGAAGPEDEWRATGTGPSGRRWNQAGWRDNDERGGGGGGRYDRQFTNGGPPPSTASSATNPRWKPEPDYRLGGGGRGGGRGGHHGGFGDRAPPGRYRDNFGGNLPEWATSEDPAGGDRGGSFDSAGKFQAGGNMGPKSKKKQ